ncbi:hypothetical protein J2Y69_003038 [Microbacterium resistens]|uniref:DUF2087 domain-containing protein n=1 Tax=Microbacterium resistens TaxID=156977 RepID=A0ABU1SFM7_9MICO|nr:DUF2087 domain-containing protein [Microbacterium resistens]MDR6868422.1 hypothetical protein [Microbacterium resistens]
MSDVRAMLACLANEDVARVFASIVLTGAPDADVTAVRRRKAVDALLRSGLITHTDSALMLNAVGIREALTGLTATSPRSDPSSRWFDPTGRIRQYPRRADERAELLSAVGEQLLAEDERLSEGELNDRLGRYTDDIPTLRRYLIVHGVLTRQTDGSAYWRP